MSNPVVRRLTEDEGIGLAEDVVGQRLRLRVRREIVAFLADLANTARVDRGAGVVGFNISLDYPDGSVGAAVKTLFLGGGGGGGGGWSSVDALLVALEGRLGTAQLNQSLLDSIEQIDAPGTGLVARVDGLTETYGSTVAAAASAATASAKQAEAVAAANSATTAANTATTQAGVTTTQANNAGASASAAATSAGAASSSAGAAGTSATASQASRLAAETAANNAGTSASAAATSASAASSSSTAAGTSATASQSARVAAETAASSAGTSSNSAATAATTAEGHASAAATHFSNTVAATGSLTASVSSLSSAVAGPGGLQAQHVLKVAATRSDGKKVFASIGLAADGTTVAGEGQILLVADQLVFVPADNINAAPQQLMTVGTVDGVTTLVVPAARIGDLTVGTAKVMANAFTDVNSLRVDYDEHTYAWGAGNRDRIFAARSVANNTGLPFPIEVSVFSARKLQTPSGMVGTTNLRTFIAILNETDSLGVSSQQDWMPELITAQAAGVTTGWVRESVSFEVVIPAGKTFTFTPYSRVAPNVGSTGSVVLTTQAFSMRLTSCKR